MHVVHRSERTRALAYLGLTLFGLFVVLASVAPAAHAGTVGVNGQIQGAGSMASTAGGPYSCSRTTNQDERNIVACQREAFGAVFNATVTLVPTASSTPAGQWSFVRWDNCDAVVGNACTVTSGPFTLDEKFPRAVFADGAAPVITSDGESFGDRSATVFFHANEPSNWFCRLDAGASSLCGTTTTFPPGKFYGGLSEGNHSVSVQAFDQSGQGSSTLQRNFTIVDTAITNVPPVLTNNRAITFNYSTVAGNAFQCSVDFAAFEACGSGTTGSKTVTLPDLAGSLEDGLHSFRVKAVNGGFQDQAPELRNWTLDTTAPETTLGAGGPGEGSLSTLTTAVFSFTSTEFGSTFQCRLGADAFATCVNPKTVSSLTPGAKTFDVRAIDPAGNTDPTPARRSWTVAIPDVDGDGFNSAQDCNDNDANVNPGKTEILNNDVDENCDGVKGFDSDGDGVQPPSDCDDGNAGVNPNRPEVLDNDVDENCDGVKGINFDRDGDGFPRPADCRDDNAAIRPGVADIPDNGVDENCDGSDAKSPPKPVISSTVSYLFGKPGARATRFTVFQVKSIPGGSTVEIRCNKCGKKFKKFVKRNVGGNLSVRHLRRSLPVGTVIQVRVIHSGMTGIVKTVKVEKRKSPSISTMCLQEGSSTPTACG